MAEAISIYFIQPLILTALSAVFLGEQIRQRRIVAIIIGLLGVVIILQPSIAIFGIPALFPWVLHLPWQDMLLLLGNLQGRRTRIKCSLSLDLRRPFFLGLHAYWTDF